MWLLINKIFDSLPPLESKKEPVVALLLGFFCGGIGLGIYFKSLLDLFLPLVMFLMLSVVLPGVGSIMGAIVASVYGLLRVIISNAKIDKQAAGSVPQPTPQT